MLDLFDHAARLRWQALDIEPTFRQLRAQISDTSSLELLLNPGCRVIVPDHLADSILLEQNGVFLNHLHGIERRHLPAQHVDDSAIAVLVSDSYGESIMATATWIDESLIDDAATRRQFNWPTMIYAGGNVGVAEERGNIDPELSAPFGDSGLRVVGSGLGNQSFVKRGIER